MEPRPVDLIKVVVGIAALFVVRRLPRPARWAVLALLGAETGRRIWAYLHTPA